MRRSLQFLISAFDWRIGLNGHPLRRCKQAQTRTWKIILDFLAFFPKFVFLEWILSSLPSYKSIITNLKMGGKKITKKSLTTKTGPTHPNSRRALQLQRIDHRTNKLQLAKKLRKKSTDNKTERILSLIILLPPDLRYVPDLAYLHSFIQSSFLERHSDELKEIESQHRPGRPTPMALIQLREKVARERTEYENGIDIPDLMNEANVKLLRDWQGDANALGLFRFVRISGNDKEQYTITQKGSHKSIEEASQHQKAQAEAEQEKMKD